MLAGGEAVDEKEAFIHRSSMFLLMWAAYQSLLIQEQTEHPISMKMRPLLTIQVKHQGDWGSTRLLRWQQRSAHVRPVS